MSSLDLDKGDEARAERISNAQAQQEKARAQREANKSKSSSSKKSSGGTRTDTDLVSRLGEAFTRLADQLEARDDHELAEAIRDGREAMSRSLVSLTRTVVFLRQPLVFFLGLLEPILAFWRVGSIVGGRFVERRQRVMAEREAAMAGATQAPPVA